MGLSSQKRIWLYDLTLSILKVIGSSVLVMHKPVAACFLVVNEGIGGRIPFNGSSQFIGYVAYTAGDCSTATYFY